MHQNAAKTDRQSLSSMGVESKVELQRDFFFFFFFFCLFRAAPEAFGGSQARGQIRATTAQAMPHPQQHQIQAVSVSYTITHSNTGSITH